MRLISSRRPGRVRYRAVIRFSVFDPEWTGWRATNSGAFSSAQEYRAALWSEQRLALRFQIFGQWAAPLYQQMAQSQDFRVLVQHSADLPEPWLGRLHELAGSYPVLVPMPVDGYVDPGETVLADLARQRAGAGPVVLLRVDDDDLLSVDFLERLAPHVTPAHDGWCVSLGRGVAARVGQHGRLVDLRRWSQPLTSIGQAYLGSLDRRGRPSGVGPVLSHRQVPETLPTVLDSRQVAWVQVRHRDQDTRVGQDPEAAQRALVKGMAKLAPVDTDAEFADLARRFPVLADDLEQGRKRRERRRARAAEAG